jgi:hypothetical protein
MAMFSCNYGLIVWKFCSFSILIFLFVFYRKEGWKGLVDEIEMEVKRISERNLGRDDRYGHFAVQSDQQ